MTPVRRTSSIQIRSRIPTGLLPTVVFLLASFSTSCISMEPGAKVPQVVDDVPSSFTEIEIDGTYSPLHWWTTFEDPLLNRLVDSALVANLDLVEAFARVEEVRARFRSTRAGRFPALSATGDVSYQDSPTNSGFAAIFNRLRPDSLGASEGSGRFDNTTYSAGLGFSYELDFWGRARNDARAALHEARASEADLATVRLGVIGETISTYFEIVDLRARIAFTREIIGVLTDRVEQAADRYDRGLISSFELYQLRQDFRNTQASLPDLVSQLTDAEARLAVVLGRYAGHIESFTGDSPLQLLDFEPIPPGLPADLLVQRPDVRAAAYRFEAARYRIGARRAELFPSLSLSGSVGAQSSNLSDLLDVIDQWTLNLGAGITAPLFQGGRLRANVDASKAQYMQQAAAYVRTVLVAFQEVVTAMKQLEQAGLRYAFFQAQLEEAEASADLQARRYEAGVADYTAYLDALRTLYQVKASLSSAGRQVALARLAVHRALGGGWTHDGDYPRLEFVSGPLRLTATPDTSAADSP